MIQYLIFLILISRVMCEEDYIYTIFTQKCFKTLFDEQIWSSDCLMEAASRILSILIVVFSILNQMPQIYKIIKFKSVAGLAFNSTYNEVKLNQFNFQQQKSFLITFNIAYNLHKGTSFVLYGENVFVLLQFFIIMILFYIYDDFSKRRLYLRKGIIYLVINIPLILGYGPDYLFNLTIYINMILSNSVYVKTTINFNEYQEQEHWIIGFLDLIIELSRCNNKSIYFICFFRRLAVYFFSHGRQCINNNYNILIWILLRK